MDYKEISLRDMDPAMQTALRIIIMIAGFAFITASAVYMAKTGYSWLFLFASFVYLALADGLRYGDDFDIKLRYLLRFATYLVLGLALTGGGVILLLMGDEGINGADSNRIAGLMLLGAGVICAGSSVSRFLVKYIRARREEKAASGHRSDRLILEKVKIKEQKLERLRPQNIMQRVKENNGGILANILWIISLPVYAAIAWMGIILNIRYSISVGFLITFFAARAGIRSIRLLLGFGDKGGGKKYSSGHKPPPPPEKKLTAAESLQGLDTEYSAGDMSEEEYKQRLKEIINQ